MNKVAILLHFSKPRWPIVNKMSGIAKSLNVKMVHCPTVEKLEYALDSVNAERVLLFTDEGMISFISELSKRKFNFHLNVAIFVESKISKVSLLVSQIKIVKYLLEFDESDSYGRHLSILIKKFKDKNILDLDKYLSFGATISTMTLDSNVTKKEALDKIHHFIMNLGDSGYAHPFGEYARRISEMVDELLINSIFNANPRFKDVDRSLPFTLNENEKIELSWGYDGEYFGVSVRDPFGQLTSEAIMEHVSSQKKIDTVVNSKSAGLGLKLIFDRTHQLITNVKKEKVTEVIAIVKFENRILDFEKTKKSFFYFTDSSEVDDN